MRETVLLWLQCIYLFDTGLFRLFFERGSLYYIKKRASTVAPFHLSTELWIPILISIRVLNTTAGLITTVCHSRFTFEPTLYPLMSPDLQQPCGPTTYTDSSNLVASTSQFVASSFIEGQPQALSSYHQDVSLPLHGASSSPAAIARRNLPTELFPGDSKEERERRCLLKELTDCKWFVDNEHEPPYAFRPFVNEMSTNDYRCTVVKCGKRLNRLDRAQDHFRKHINHRPHPCHGKCGFLSWWVSSVVSYSGSLSASSSQRFYTRETLKAHTRKGTNRVVCSIWSVASIYFIGPKSSWFAVTRR